jgi:hypothetical protein
MQQNAGSGYVLNRHLERFTLVPRRPARGLGAVRTIPSLILSVVLLALPS